MSVNYVQSNQAITHNGNNLTRLNFQTGVVSGQTVLIPTAQQGAFVIAAFWRIPETQAGILINYVYQEAFTSVKPTPDSLKVLRIKWERETWEIAILDTDYVGSTNTFGTLADGLGGALALMPAVTIPFPIIQNYPVTNTPVGGGSENTFIFAFPPNPLGLQYSIPWPWFNGVAPAQPYDPSLMSPPSTITTPGEFVTWANTNWGHFGTWSRDRNMVQLVSPTSADIPVSMAGVLAQLTPVSWCLDCTSFSSPTPVNGLEINGATTIPFPAFQLTNTNMQSLINAITPFLEDGAVLTVVGEKINIVTVLGQVKIYNNTSLVATATLGSC